MVYITWNDLVLKNYNFFVSYQIQDFFSKSQNLPVEILKIMESGIFIRILFLAINIISDLKWWAVSTYLIKYKGVNFSIRAINDKNSKKKNFYEKTCLGTFNLY